MNFLAHIYLSNDDPGIMVGNFIGDFVKGRNFADRYDRNIANGIELHRMIDEFTDRHEMVGKSKQKLRPKYRHYSAVIVDIFYDHFLANLWDNYHTTPLKEYAKNAYLTLEEHRSILPVEVKKMLPYMIKDNWLVNYGNLNGISQALNGISRRTRYDSKMNESVHELKEFYEDFKKEFQSFIPELKLYTERFLKSKAGYTN
jgi:acyl carrier protein phosphodiesterase